VTRSLIFALAILPAAFGAQDSNEIRLDSNFVLVAGVDKGTVQTIPFAGQWWSFAGGKLSKGLVGSDDFTWNSGTKSYDPAAGIADNDASALLKYDRWHQKKYGTDSGSAAAELNDDTLNHHVDPDEATQYQQQGVNFGWWGHCNGWAASSLSEKEPHAPITSNGIRFDVSDLKGMLAEVYWGVQAYFTGRRYNDYGNLKPSYEDAKVLLNALNSGSPLAARKYKDWYVKMYRELYDDPSYTLPGTYKPADFKAVLEWFISWYEENVIEAYKDIYPHVFHQILVTHIKNGSGVVFDMEAGAEVWNFPAHAYESNVTFLKDRVGGGKTFSVTTTLYYQSDGVDYSILGVVEHAQTYTYELDTDAAGKLVDSRWTGASVDKHPDFAWIPTYNPTGPDADENSKIEYGKVLEILSNDHQRGAARVATLHLNGTPSDALRIDREARTIRNALSASGTMSLTTTISTGASVDRVAYYRQAVSKVFSENRTYFAAVRGDLEYLGDGSGADWALSWTGTQAGRHHFVVMAFQGADLVSLDESTVQYGIQSGADDPAEDNDSQSTATVLSTALNGICSDEDWYSVTGSKTVTITFQNSVGDLDAALLDTSGKVVALSDSVSDVETLQVPSGTYFVRVYSFQGSGVPYTISPGAGTSTGTDDSYEQNDTKSTSATVASGTYPALQCLDEDWYKIAVQPGTFKVSIQFTHASGDLDMYLYNPTKLVGRSTSTTNSETITYSVTKATTLYIRVFGYQGAKNSYSMTVQ